MRRAWHSGCRCLMEGERGDVQQSEYCEGRSPLSSETQAALCSCRTGEDGRPVLAAAAAAGRGWAPARIRYYSLLRWRMTCLVGDREGFGEDDWSSQGACFDEELIGRNASEWWSFLLNIRTIQCGLHSSGYAARCGIPAPSVEMFIWPRKFRVDMRLHLWIRV